MASIQLGTSTNPSSVMSLAYNYGTTNNNGNVLNQTITRFNPTTQSTQTWTQSYGYQDGTGDQLNRLVCAAETPTASGVTCDNNVAGTGANWYRTFGYDPFANGWVKLNSNATLALNASTPVAPSNFDSTNHLQINGTSYDGAGNQSAIGVGGYTFSYDAENRMTSSKINGGTTQYTYDGDGRRVMKTWNFGTASASTTTYVYDAMGQLAAEYGTPTAPDSGTKFVTVDHLGSTRLVTDLSQNQETCYDYLPFGEQIPGGTDGRTASCFTSTATPLTSKFTGKERDAEITLSDTRPCDGGRGGSRSIRRGR